MKKINLKIIVAIIITIYSINSFGFGASLLKDTSSWFSKKVTSQAFKNQDVAFNNLDIKKISRDIRDTSISKDNPKKTTAKLTREKIGKLTMSPSYREDFFMELIYLQKENHVTRVEAKKILESLKGVDGFLSALSKIAGANANKSRGHLAELRLAVKAKEKHFKVVSIGKTFKDDPNKKLTDIDLIISKKGKEFIIEVKDYYRTGPPNLDTVIRPDIETLNAYSKKYPNKKIIKVFYMTNTPSNPNYKKQIEKISKENNVHFIYGDSGLEASLDNISQLM